MTENPAPFQECPNCQTKFNLEGHDGFDPQRHQWFDNEDHWTCPTCATEVGKP